MDKLSKDYFEKFRVRILTLHVFFREADYSDVIREGQEALELFIKALLRQMKIQPDFGHDPGKQLRQFSSKVPPAFKADVPALVHWSKRLRKERELAYYGAEDFIPSEEYSKEDAQEVIEFLESIQKKI